MDFNEKQWRAQEDLRCLMEARQIRGDKKRMKAARAEAERQRKALEQVDD